MSTDQKFLATVGALLALLVVSRVAPCAALTIFVVLLWVAYVVVMDDRRR